MNKTIKSGSVASPLVATLMAMLFNMGVAEARPNAGTCPVGHSLSKTFSSGAKWDMCWEARAEEGIVLSEVYYKPAGNTRRRVLGEAGLSQIHTEYDDGSADQFLVTGSGLGGSNLQTLNASICEGQLHQDSGRNVLCSVTKASGYIYRYRNSTRRQGSQFDIYSISTAGSREFIVRWTFLENGTIEPAIGLTGKFIKTTSDSKAGWPVTSQNKIATSFVDHYFWRLDFDLANDSDNDIVEQIKSIPSTSRLTKTKQTCEVSCFGFYVATS